ncbi:MAG: hypothetical protein HYW05_00205 [Candidatus Diapherotrites archaeon]|nr:hypothetical protein [Candidatus Diapherotrites archaeon]
MCVGISTGCCHDLGLDRLEGIHYLEKFRGMIDAVEVVLAYPEEVQDFEFDERAVAFLKGLSSTSIHMPFKNAEYTGNKETADIMAKAVKLAGQINAKYLLFHPTNVKDFNAIRAEMPICIENMNEKPESEGFQTAEEMNNLLRKYGFLNLVLDAGHVIGNKLKPSDFLIMKNKLKAMHVSARWIKDGKLKEHGFLCEADPAQIEEIREVSAAGVPMIIETDFYPEKAHLIEKEINLIKGLHCP